MASSASVIARRRRPATDTSDADDCGILHADHYHLGYFELGYSETKGLDLESSQQRHLEMLFQGQVLGADDVAVDVGCGLGNTARWIRRTYGANVIGVDSFAAALRRSRLRDDLPVAQSDMANLPLQSDKVELVVGVESVYVHPRRDVVFAEFARVLRPGGVMLLSEYLLGDEPRRVLTRMVQAVAHTDSLASEKCYREWLERAGFVDVEVVDVGEFTAVATAEFLKSRSGLRHDLSRRHLGRARGTMFSYVVYPLCYRLWCTAFARRRTRHVFVKARRNS